MKRLAVIALVITLLSQVGWAQVPFEQVRVFTNQQRFVVGENLLLKVYCLDDEARISHFSKVAFLELIDQWGNSVMRKKVRLDRGTGSLVYFLPSNMKTGNYSLVGYTKWMKDTDAPTMTRQTITIINPFAVPERPPVAASAQPTSVSASEVMNGLSVGVDKTVYGLREKVTIQVAEDIDPADLHVSVRKVDAYGVSPSNGPTTAQASREVAIDGRTGDLRGNMISGIMLLDDTPAANETVYLTIPGKDYIFHAARTNAEGRFHIMANDIYGEVELILTANVSPDKNPEFHLDEEFLTSLDGLMPETVTIGFISQQMDRGAKHRCTGSKCLLQVQSGKGDGTFSGAFLRRG